MCLITSNNVGHAKEDIVVYKILVKRLSNGVSTYVTPYMFVEVNPEIGQEVADDASDKPEVRFNPLYDPRFICEMHDYIYLYTRGWIHSYMNEKDCIHVLKSNCFVGRGYIFKCIIPKGTEYVSGYYFGSLNYPSIASKKLVYLPDSVKTFN